MVMLTSGQVSMAISSSIIFLFTSLLFLSGYVLQQQTVRGLQEAIKPRIPSPIPKAPPSAPPLDPRARLRRPFGFSKLSDEYDALQSYFSTKEPEINWSRLAYVQIVKDHTELCSAVMVFGELYKYKSPARRVLLFPKAWAVQSKGEVEDPILETTQRLMRKAARRYRVVLQPIDTMSKDDDASSPSSYSLASIFSLTEYDRVLYLNPPGIFLESYPLDSLLAFASSASVAALPTDDKQTNISTSLLLVEPSTSTFEDLSTLRNANDSIHSDSEIFQTAFQPPSSLLSNVFTTDHVLISSTGAIVKFGDRFDAAEYLDKTAYVQLWDPTLPGPEYDMPYQDRLNAQPKNEDARRIWAKLYEQFKEQRMDFCGLDLDTYTPPKKKADEL